MDGVIWGKYDGRLKIGGDQRVLSGSDNGHPGAGTFFQTRIASGKLADRKRRPCETDGLERTNAYRIAGGSKFVGCTDTSYSQSTSSDVV
jgi:hypothetical protein